VLFTFVYPNTLPFHSVTYCLIFIAKVEHTILTLTRAREYYPPEDTPLDRGPTRGCQEAIRCLENHCKLLKGSTSKEVLEVFYQEVGLRLIGCVPSCSVVACGNFPDTPTRRILQKHIKRQIISLSGGFQVIADLNAYNAFISSLKVRRMFYFISIPIRKQYPPHLPYRFLR